MERFGRAWRARREGKADDKRRRGESSDPHELFYRAHTERQRTLDEARRALADLAVHERRADLLAHQSRETARRLQKDAAAAVERGEDQRAHELLDRVVDQEQAARQWLGRRDDLAGQLAESRRTLERLERQAEQARARQMALLADTEAAQARERIARAVPQMEEGLGELNRRMAQAEALAAARAEVAWHDPGSDRVVRAFEELAHEQDVRERLQQINRESEQERRRLDPGGAGSPGAST